MLNYNVETEHETTTSNFLNYCGTVLGYNVDVTVIVNVLVPMSVGATRLA